MSESTAACAVCHVEMIEPDLREAVLTDAGLVHRECFEGPVPPGSEGELDALEEAAENERRADHGEPPLDPNWPEDANVTFSGFRSAEENDPIAQMSQRIREREMRGGFDPHPPPPPGGLTPLCLECGTNPSSNGGRCMECRGKKMVS